MEINFFKSLWTTRKAFILSVAAKCQFVPSRKTWSEWEKTELVLYISLLLQLFDLNPEPNTGILFCPGAVYNLTGSATLSKTPELWSPQPEPVKMHRLWLRADAVWLRGCCVATILVTVFIIRIGVKHLFSRSRSRLDRLDNTARDHVINKYLKIVLF